MFTGLVEAAARVAESTAGSLRVDLSMFEEDVETGASVAVNGVCLTVAEKSPAGCRFDISKETAAKTTLGNLRENDIVNAERAMRASDRIGGHFVTGHVDGTGSIREIRPESLVVSLSDALMKGVVKKGSIAVDGISLTVASVMPDGFSAAIIPHTFQNTNLRAKKVGGAVNVETDIIGKYVRGMLRLESGITLQKLREHGF